MLFRITDPVTAQPIDLEITRVNRSVANVRVISRDPESGAMAVPVGGNYLLQGGDYSASHWDGAKAEFLKHLADLRQLHQFQAVASEAR